MLAAFVANERRQRAPLAPLSIFRINGLGFSNVTQLVAFAGFLALFFFVTLYMQNVLGYSAVQTGLAYLPLCGIAVVSAGITSQLLARVGTRPVIVVGALIGAGGLYWLSRIPVDGSYTADLLPGLLLVGFGIAGLFVGRRNCRERGRAGRQSGARGGAAQRVAMARRRARPRDLHGRVDEPHQPPARRGSIGFACPDVGLPAGTAGRQHLHPRLRGDRAARDEHAGRDRRADDRGGAGGFARSLMNAEVWASIGTIVATLVLLIIPGLVYTWYALEHIAEDEN